MIKDTSSFCSCARKMCHLLLADYEDVPPFPNQWKLLGVYIIRQILTQRER